MFFKEWVEISIYIPLVRPFHEVANAGIYSFRLWNIHTTGQYGKWQITKEFNSSRKNSSLLCSKLINYARLDKELIFLLAFLCNDSICCLKLRLFSILILKSLRNCFISDCDFTEVITRKMKVMLTRISFHTVVVKPIQKWVY